MIPAIFTSVIALAALIGCALLASRYRLALHDRETLSAGYNDTDEVTLTALEVAHVDSDRYPDAPRWEAFEVQVNGEHVGYLIDRGELVPGGGRYRYASADIDGVPIDSHTGIGEAITTVLEVRLEMARR